MRPTPIRAVVLLALLLAACDSGDNAAPRPLDTLAPTDTLPPTSSTSAASTTSSTGVPVTRPAGTIALSPDGPWKLVDSAPGITTPGLVYELMPGLWAYLPTVEDIPHGITWVLNQDDLPVIEAYLMAELTYYRAITSNPIDLTKSNWAKYYTDAVGTYYSDLASRRDQGQVGDLGAGVVLRPIVLGEERSESKALVYDCILDGGVFKLPGGALAPGSTPGVANYGEGAEMAFAKGSWLVSRIGSQVDAC